MKLLFKIAILAFALIINANICPAARIKNPYKSFVIVKDKIYTLTGGGYLKIYNTGTGKLEAKYTPAASIEIICKDHMGDLITVSNNDEISRLKGDGKWERVGRYHGNIFSIAFNSKNVCFLVTNRGMYNCITQEVYLPESKFSHSESSGFGKGNGWETSSYHYDHNMSGYMSGDDVFWASSDHGEWGTDLFIFDTNTNTFFDYTIVAGLPRFDINGRVFGMFDALFGIEVVTYDKKAAPDGTLFYEGRICYKQENDTTLKNGDWFLDDFYVVGDCTYNKADALVYLITAKGLFTIDPKNPPSKFSELTTVPNFKMITHRVEAFPFQLGTNKKKRYEMRPEFISQIEFAPNAMLVMLESSRGLRLFDGKKTIIAQ